LTSAGARKAIDSVMLIWRTLQFCRCARPSIEVVPAMISSSHWRPRAIERISFDLDELSGDGEALSLSELGQGLPLGLDAQP
jgi:hypothetical protein